MATEEQRASLAKQRGLQAARMKDPEERKRYVSESADIDKNYEGVAQATSAMENVLNKRELLGSLKKGGKVKKTGAYFLHRGEKVVPSDEDVVKAAAAGLKGEKKEGAKSPYRSTSIEHHGDGSHTVRHTPRSMEGKMPEEKSYASADTKTLLKMLAHHLSGEEAAESPAEEAGESAAEEAAEAGNQS